MLRITEPQLLLSDNLKKGVYTSLQIDVRVTENFLS